MGKAISYLVAGGTTFWVFGIHGKSKGTPPMPPPKIRLRDNGG